MQNENSVHELTEIAKLWDRVFIISISVIDEDEVPARVKSVEELLGELSALEDRNGVALCAIVMKEYQPGQMQIIWRPRGDFNDDPWAKRTYEFYLESCLNSLAEKGCKIQNLQPGNLH